MKAIFLKNSQMMSNIEKVYNYLLFPKFLTTVAIFNDLVNLIILDSAYVIPSVLCRIIFMLQAYF
jgi:hypothetical protein